MATIPNTRRRFGVEIECVFPDEAEGIREAFDRTFPSTGSYRSTRTAWGVHHDSSLPYGGLEFSSPPLNQRGAQSFRHLKDVMDWIKGRGGYVTAACGMHVHIEASDLTKYELARMARSWHANQHHINQLVDMSRHNNGYCNTLSNYEMEAIERDLRNPAMNTLNGYDRGAFNLTALREHGTIEFRQHHGCVDFDEAEGWIRFLLGFFRNNIERKNPMPPYKELKTIINRAKPSKRVVPILNMKIEKSLRGEALLQLRPDAPAYDSEYDEGDYGYDDDDDYYEDDPW